jgi:hypothetical protein
MTKTGRLGLAGAALVLALLWPAGAAVASGLGDPDLDWAPVAAIPGSDFGRPCVVGTVGRAVNGDNDAVTITLRWDEQRDPTCALTSDEFPAARVMLWPDMGDPGTKIDYVMGPYREDNAVVDWTEFHTDPVTITLPGPGRYFAYFQGSWYGVGFLTVAGTASTGTATADGGAPAWVWPVVAVVVLAGAGAGWYAYRRR